MLVPGPTREMTTRCSPDALPVEGGGSGPAMKPHCSSLFAVDLDCWQFALTAVGAVGLAGAAGLGPRWGLLAIP